MKKLISLVCISMFMIILCGCSNNDFSTGSSAKAEQVDSSYLDAYAVNPQVPDDGTLLTVGQSVKDGKGEATLQKINLTEQSTGIGSIQLTVKDTKLIHLFPDYSMTDYFHGLTHNEEFDFVKIFVEIKNNSNEKLNFAPIAIIETNTGEKLSWEQDIYLENLNGEMEKKTTKRGNLGFIVDSKDDLEWIEITTSDVFDKDEKKIADAQKFRIEF
ncbi:hypothetical protein JFL43_16130 [Viridibacillus sp. YIM B01967]|uniref:DUF4352 domain-containing protein n=1 Tax=Viridibacillus soli TaxID=2798301 RepID=A0ABS1HAC0_9BACL|nr:hypothetical protein [Viridibacillus soli]MBK3496360.1 hypothetical protein [Viridibacillus soli]